MARGPAIRIGERIVPLWREMTSIGRSDPGAGAIADIDLTADDTTRMVSRRHAEVACGDGGAEVRDVGSTNGTWLNGEQLPALVDRPLQEGDSISFGGVQSTFIADAEWPPGITAEWALRTVVARPGDDQLSPHVSPAAGSDPNRVLGTVMFTDIAQSTVRAAELGDRQWLDLLRSHQSLVRLNLRHFGGREIDTAGDGFLALFTSPAGAIHCALAIREGSKGLGIQIRAGLHTGECIVTPQGIGGIAVHIGSRVESKAEPDEVLVSATVKELVIGSGLRFHDRGVRALKGVPGKWRLFAAEAETEG